MSMLQSLVTVFQQATVILLSTLAAISLMHWYKVRSAGVSLRTRLPRLRASQARVKLILFLELSSLSWTIILRLALSILSLSQR